jgi:predicted acyl esterase
MQVRQVDGSWRERPEFEWPLKRTRWTKLYLDAAAGSLVEAPAQQASKISYRGLSEGASFVTPPLAEETEITGPIATKLFVSSTTEDVDLFVVVRVFNPELKEITFQGHTDPHTTIAQGWLRASHRKLDPDRTLPYRPYHTHDQIQKLTPGDIYELDIEVWPTCIVIPTGYRIAVTVRGKDYEYPGGVGGPGVKMLGVFTGVGPFRHDEVRDRPPKIFDGEVTLHTGPVRAAHVLLPFIPAE